MRSCLKYFADLEKVRHFLPALKIQGGGFGKRGGDCDECTLKKNGLGMQAENSSQVSEEAKAIQLQQVAGRSRHDSQQPHQPSCHQVDISDVRLGCVVFWANRERQETILSDRKS